MQKREQQGTKQNRKARKEKKQKTSHHHHNHNHNHNNNNNKNVRFNPLRQVSLPKKGPVTPVIYPWISKAITVDLTRANSNDPRSQQIHQKKCWRNAAVSIRFLQATAWPSLLRNTVWKFLQKLGCKKFLPPWVECCIRAARYRLTITPGIKKKVLAECCSVHQIFAGNRLTITSEKHSVEIAAETWM